MITFKLNRSSGIPPYLQIVHQVKQALLIGKLAPGDRLPTVKEVVSQISINPNTVFKAYRELEMIGLIEGRTGSGTFVKNRLAGPPPTVQEALLKGLSGWVKLARKAGLDNDAIEAVLRIALDEA